MDNQKSSFKRGNRILVIGSEPFAKNAYYFFDSFRRYSFYYDLNSNHYIIKIIKIFRYFYLILLVDIVYIIGYFKPDSIYIKIAKLFKKKIIVHWIGSEVLKLSRKHYQRVDGAFSVTMDLKRELERHNIPTIHLPLFLQLDLDDVDLDFEEEKLHRILFYLPNNKEMFYGLKYLILLARVFSQTKFYVIGSTKITFSENNIFKLGYLDNNELNSVLRKTTIYVRITEHDGLSQLLLRTLSLGKTVVSNTRYSYVVHFDSQSKNDDDLIKVISNLITNKPMINVAAIKFMREQYNNIEQLKRYRIAFNEIGVIL